MTGANPSSRRWYAAFLTFRSITRSKDSAGGGAGRPAAGPVGLRLIDRPQNAGTDIVLRDIRSGITRAEALRRMTERLDVSEVTSLVNSLIQAERMGSSLGQVLRVQADQRRNERFQRAEKLALEAPVKLIFPLILFIFPLTFLILAFPIVMKFLGADIL